MFKLALDAGHGLYTAGKRCNAAVDINETHEWVLNSRICDKIQAILSNYDGIDILRVDDTTGQTDIGLTQRTNAANNYGADFYLSIHHNSGVGCSSGGGTEAYTYTSVGQATIDWQNDLYNAVINYTGLRGNRSQPCKKADFAVLRQTNMDAVLIECGFMDSTTDTPIILTEDFANKVAQACCDVIIAHAGIALREIRDEPIAFVPTPEAAPAEINVTYQIWDDVKNCWLPNVADNSDYAGIFGHDVCCVYANLSQGSITYAVHVKGGRWLPEVTNREDYAGIFNKPIDGIMIKTDTEKTIKYRVHLRRTNKWLPSVTGYDTNDNNNGYAGIFGQEIDGIQMWLE